MALEIIWSPKALEKLHKIICFLSENWNEEVTKNFVLRTEEVIQAIAKHPHIFKQISKNNNLREAMITKHNLLIYKNTNSKITIITLFDTRQNPKKKLAKL